MRMYLSLPRLRPVVLSRTLSALGLRRTGLTLLGLLALAGCSTLQRDHDTVTGPAYEPANIHNAVARLPAEFRRVALLPLVAEPAIADVASRAMLDVIQAEELGKTRRFELLPITADQLRQWTGRSDWKSHSELPPEFLATLRRHTGCDGVMLTRLTQYSPYPPLVIGWHWTLMECPSERILWAADEVFDAREAGVVTGARRHARTQPRPQHAHPDSWSALNSPRAFAHYSAATLAGKLPPR